MLFVCHLTLNKGRKGDVIVQAYSPEWPFPILNKSAVGSPKKELTDACQGTLREALGVGKPHFSLRVGDRRAGELDPCPLRLEVSYSV